MRIAKLLFLVAVGACAGSGQEPERGGGRRYVTIGVDALETARAVVQEAAVRRGVGAAAASGERLEVLGVRGGAAVLEIDDADLEALSERMHEQHDRCGGFMVHESLEDAKEALPTTTTTDKGPIEYTLDQAALVREVLPKLDERRILATIEELSAMQNRYYQSDSGAAASTWLRDRWRGFSARQDVTVELFDHGYAQKSVILTIPGTTRPSEVVVIGGHLDSISFVGRDRKESRAPGADDDASGIATLTEVARVLLAGEYRPARTVQMIAYAAEEVGLRGSLSIVREYKKRGVNVVGALQLDMTNYQGSDRDIWLIRDFTSAAQNEFLARLIDAYVGATWGYDACGYACSDHASWHRAGIPASMPFESRADQRNRKIHTAKDTLETSGNNAAHAVKFARLAAAYAIELAKTAPAASEMTPTGEGADAAPPRPASGPDGRALAAVIGLLLALGVHRVIAGRIANAGGAGARADGAA
jgi:leucyl aminopeptidase